MTKTKKKEKAKPKLIPCPNECGEKRPEGEPVYTCVDCGKTGFDCCIAGSGVICGECEFVEDEEQNFEDPEGL
jgi:hypothetical protein